MRHSIALILLLQSLTAFAQSPPAAAASDSRPPLLKALDGDWQMTGDVRGKAVTYAMHAAPTLQDKFTEIHMTDVQRPPKYEARLFIAYDPLKKSLIAHWLDNFGGEASIPHASGQIEGNTIEFVFPYKDGPFRDRLTYDSKTSSWTFTIEAGSADDRWRHFARYDMRRQ